MFGFVPKLDFPQVSGFLALVRLLCTPLLLWGRRELATGVKVISAFTNKADLEAETQDKLM